MTVQPMVPHGGYELILGSSIDPQFGPSSYSAPADILSKSLKIVHLGFRRSIGHWHGG